MYITVDNLFKKYIVFHYQLSMGFLFQILFLKNNLNIVFPKNQI